MANETWMLEMSSKRMPCGRVELRFWRFYRTIEGSFGAKQRVCHAKVIGKMRTIHQQ